MNLRIKTTILIICTICSNALAQQKWTLDDCVSYALEHNLQLKDFNYTTDSNREAYRQSIRNILPNVSASTNYIISFGRAEDPNTGTFVTRDFFSNSYNLNGSIDLFQGFQKWNSIRASKFLYQATQEEATHQKYLLAFRVMQAFYDIRFFEGLLAISQEQRDISQQNYDLVEKQIELGLMAGADLYEAESLLLTDKLNVTQARNQLAAAKLSLIQQMNLDGVDTIDIQTDLEAISTLDNKDALEADSVYGIAKDFVPLIEAQELRAKAAKKQLAAERGNLYPSLNLFAGYRTGYFETTVDSLGMTVPFRDQFRDNASEFIGVSLTIPITEGWSRRSRVKQQKIAFLREKNNLQIREQELRQTIQQLVQDYNSLLVELEQSDQQVKAQSLAFTIAQKRYEKGLLNAIELFTAKNLFANAQNENLQVRLRSEINKSTLDFYQGLPVFNIN